MFRSKDFLLMDVLNIKGKKIGCIKDLIIDFNMKIMKGFIGSSNSFFSKDIYVFRDDIVSFNNNMIVKGYQHCETLKFSDIKNMDVVNKSGEIIGMVDDVIFERETFSLKAIVVSTGFMRNFLSGKKIILLDKLVLGDRNIFCYSDNNKISLSSVPHKPMMDEICNEEII